MRATKDVAQAVTADASRAISGGGGGVEERSTAIVSNGVFGMTLFVLAEAMLFAGLISGIEIIKASSMVWPPPGQPRLPIGETALNTAALVASAGYDLQTSLSVAFSVTANVGPALGAVGPEADYSHFPNYVKLGLGFGMLAGRLDIFTLFILLQPKFWRS